MSSTSKISDCVVAHRSDRGSSLDKPVPTGQTGLELLQHRLQFFGLGFVDQPRNPVVSGEPLVSGTALGVPINNGETLT
jgi:hypothetical protein